MKVPKLKLTLSIIGLFAASSCGYMARSIFTPNQCQRCEVLHRDGTVIWSEEECGGGIYNMEDRAKVEAYDRGCDYSIRCNTYKKEKTE
jgi:hypothetical protein